MDPWDANCSFGYDQQWIVDHILEDEGSVHVWRINIQRHKKYTPLLWTNLLTISKKSQNYKLPVIQ